MQVMSDVQRKFLQFTGVKEDGRCARCRPHEFLVEDGPDNLGRTFMHSYINHSLGGLGMKNVIHHWAGTIWWPCRQYYKEIA